MLLSSFCVGQLLLGVQPTLNCACMLSETPLEKLDLALQLIGDPFQVRDRGGDSCSHPLTVLGACLMGPLLGLQDVTDSGSLCVSMQLCLEDSVSLK